MKGSEDPREALIRDAIDRGAVNEAIKQVFVELRSGDWGIIRSEARRQGLRTADPAFCEDVLQKVVVDLWQSLSSGRQEEIKNVGGFLRTLVRRTIYDMQQKDRRLELATRAEEEQLEEQPDPAASPEDTVGFAEALRGCLEAQSPLDRHVLWYHLEFPSPSDAARQLGIPIGTFHVRLLRTRGRLKGCLETKGYVAEEQRHGSN